MEFHSIENEQAVNILNHIDVGAGIYGGKRFTKNFSVELGVIKNDYSSKFDISTTYDKIPVRAFENFVYPTYTSYQLGVLGNYRKALGENWALFGQAGFHLFISKKLSRDGSVFTNSELVDSVGGVLRQFEMITYSHNMEAGNLIFRGDLGLYYNVSSSLAIEMSISGRMANLPIHSFKIDYDLNDANPGKQVKITNSGKSLGLQLGIKYVVNSY